MEELQGPRTQDHWLTVTERQEVQRTHICRFASLDSQTFSLLEALFWCVCSYTIWHISRCLEARGMKTHEMELQTAVSYHVVL